MIHDLRQKNGNGAIRRLGPKTEARGIRTPNLRVWNPTRYRCAIASYMKIKNLVNSYSKNALKTSTGGGQMMSQNIHFT